MSNIMAGIGLCLLLGLCNLVLPGLSSDGLGVFGGESVCIPMHKPEKQEKKSGYVAL